MQIAGGVIILFGDAAASDFREKFDELVNEYRNMLWCLCGVLCFFVCSASVEIRWGGQTADADPEDGWRR
jgi:hypothetical protein